MKKKVFTVTDATRDKARMIDDEREERMGVNEE